MPATYQENRSRHRVRLTGSLSAHCQYEGGRQPRGRCSRRRTPLPEGHTAAMAPNSAESFRLLCRPPATVHKTPVSLTRQPPRTPTRCDRSRAGRAIGWAVAPAPRPAALPQPRDPARPSHAARLRQDPQAQSVLSHPARAPTPANGRRGSSGAHPARSAAAEAAPRLPSPQRCAPVPQPAATPQPAGPQRAAATPRHSQPNSPGLRLLLIESSMLAAAYWHPLWRRSFPRSCRSRHRPGSLGKSTASTFDCRPNFVEILPPVLAFAPVCRQEVTPAHKDQPDKIILLNAGKVGVSCNCDTKKIRYRILAAEVYPL